jgi:uncharacterized protein (TIGR02246 family)
MRTLTRLLITGLMTFFYSAVTLGDGSAGVEAAVVAWEKTYADKANRETLYTLYAEDAVLWGTSLREPAQGLDAIKAYFARSSRGTIVTLEYERPMLIRVDGDGAVNSGKYIAKWTESDGNPRQVSYRYTITYRKIVGTWKIVAHHSSGLPKKK